MPYPQGLMVCEFQFSLHGPSAEEDIAEMGLWFQTETQAPPADWDTYLATVAESAYEGWVNHADASKFRTSCELAQVLARGYDTSLHTVAEQIYAPDDLWAGSASSQSLPWQDSFVVGLYAYQPETFSPNSRHKRGRVFMPPMVTSVLDQPSDAGMVPATVENLVGMISGTIAAISSGPTDPVPIPKVVSRTVQNCYTIGWLRATNYMSTQRRRMHQIPKVVYSTLLA